MRVNNELITADRYDFGNNLIILTLSLLGALGLILLWLGIWEFVPLDNLPPGFLVLPAIPILWGLYTSADKLLNQGIPQLRFGLVSVEFSGQGQLEATVSIEPRQTISLKEITLAVRLIELSGSTLGRRSKVKIFEETGHLLANQRLESASKWSGHLTIPVQADLPASDTRFSKDRSDISYEWQVEVNIIDDRWPPWRKNFVIEVQGNHEIDR